MYDSDFQVGFYTRLSRLYVLSIICRNFLRISNGRSNNRSALNSGLVASPLLAIFYRVTLKNTGFVLGKKYYNSNRLTARAEFDSAVDDLRRSIDGTVTFKFKNTVFDNDRQRRE